MSVAWRFLNSSRTHSIIAREGASKPSNFSSKSFSSSTAVFHCFFEQFRYPLQCPYQWPFCSSQVIEPPHSSHDSRPLNKGLCLLYLGGFLRCSLAWTAS